MMLPLYPFCSPRSLYTDITVNTCAISISSISVSPWSSSGTSLRSMLFSAENFFGNFFSELQCQHIPLTRIIDRMRSLYTLQPLYSILSFCFRNFARHSVLPRLLCWLCLIWGLYLNYCFLFGSFLDHALLIHNDSVH